jgi:hypothetical protein
MARKFKHYTEEEFSILKQCYFEGMKPYQIHLAFKEKGYSRSISSIETKINKLKLIDLKE